MILKNNQRNIVLTIAIALCLTFSFVIGEGKTESKKQDEKVTEYTLFYKNGSKEEKGIWKEDKIIGSFTRFHENGQIAQELSYNGDGRLNGIQKYFYPNGQLRMIGFWENGEPKGEIREYGEDGSIFAVRLFKNGKLEKYSHLQFQ